MLNTTMVHCIEGKNGRFERDARIYIDSFSSFNKIENIIMVQPNKNDINAECQDYFKINAIQYIIKDIYNPQPNKVVNYTNVPIVLDYIIDKVDTEYTLFTDLDVIYFDELILGKTDRCVITILDSKETDQFENVFLWDEYYNKYFKKDILDCFDIEVKHLTKFVNTWFIYAKTDHMFWKLYKEVTFKLLEVSEKVNKPELELEIMCEEIAASIIYHAYPEQFIDITDFKSSISFHEGDDHELNEKYNCNKNTAIYHYDDYEDFHQSVKYPLRNLDIVAKKLIKHIGLEATLAGLNLKYSQIKENIANKV